jgi:hypothetical protein
MILLCGVMVLRRLLGLILLAVPVGRVLLRRKGIWLVGNWAVVFACGSLFV